MKTRSRYLLIVLAVLAGVQPASAQQVQWDGWHPLGNNVSVSFAQVPGSTLWTWKFQNNGTTPITYMDFLVTDNTGQHPDTFPGTLKPGQIFGGWAAFTANSPPTILIKTMQTANSSSQPNNAEQQQTNQQQVLQQQIHNIYNVNSSAAASTTSPESWHSSIVLSDPIGVPYTRTFDISGGILRDTDSINPGALTLPISEITAVYIQQTIHNYGPVSNGVYLEYTSYMNDPDYYIKGAYLFNDLGSAQAFIKILKEWNPHIQDKGILPPKDNRTT